MKTEKIIKHEAKITTDDVKIGLILLAAGESRRLNGKSKQLLDFQNKTLIRHSTENALACICQPICVVLGAKAELIKNEICDLPVEVVVNENWQNGMSASLKKGLTHLLKIEPDLSAVVLHLCDLPLVTGRILNQLIIKYRDSKKRIIASQYDETFGVPSLFARKFFDELLNLDNQSGAKKLIEIHKNDTEFIKVPEAGFDIDTDEDYNLLINRKNF